MYQSKLVLSPLSRHLKKPSCYHGGSSDTWRGYFYGEKRANISDVYRRIQIECNNGNKLLPFWPKKEFAEYCAVDEWEIYSSESMELYEFMDEFLPNLRIEDVVNGRFVTGEWDPYYNELIYTG
ncbi:DUF2750 domain-containing protein [Paenibacillus sp. QZ-Y1]|uniref:DUF2750 domain-containing protein n=1 Tax=Paenibacillus sp. QZ-Y1 TaxID=3414511 RepID=UPI003F7945E0